VKAMTRVDAGSLRKRLTLQSVTRAHDDVGGYMESWADVATLWAALVTVSADRVFRARGDEMNISHRITIRHRTDVKPGMRFILDQRVFPILEVSDPDETGRYLEIETTEEVSS